MKKTGALAAMLLVTASLAQIANAAEAQPFQITLPTGFSAFAAQTQTAKSPSGKNIQVTTWVSKSPTTEAVVVSVTKLWARIENPDQQMANSRDSLVKSVNGTIDSQQKIDGSAPGMRVDFHSGNAFLRARLSVKGDSLYQLLYVGRSAEQRSNPSVDGLFQSFAISDTPAQTAAATAAH
jgi:hypothetical protein